MQSQLVSFKLILAVLIALFSGIGIGYFLGINNRALLSDAGPSSTTNTSSPKSHPSPEVTVNPSSKVVNTFPANIGIGIMGDSNSDEYRADDQRGGEYTDTTLNWMEQLVVSRGLNFGSWGTWGEPRRTGYKYNWAQSGATAASLLESGQHTGLAQQVADGEVSMVFLWIGDNDFHWRNGAYKEIYNGDLSDSEVEAMTARFISDITTAIDTVLAAGDVQMVVVTVLDQGLTPMAVSQFPDPDKRQHVTDAINLVNESIKDLAAARDIAVVDINSLSTEFLSRADRDGNLDVGGEKINLLENGDDPHFARLNDQSGHAGTVASGLIANLFFIEPFNRTYGLEITPLSDEEILRNAGIH